MTLTYYVALPFTRSEHGFTAGEAQECQSEGAAIRSAEGMSHNPANVGAIAFKRSGDRNIGEFSDAAVLVRRHEPGAAADIQHITLARECGFDHGAELCRRVVLQGLLQVLVEALRIRIEQFGDIRRWHAVCRKSGISQATYFNWKKNYDCLLPTEIRRLKQLEDQNAKLKRIVVDLSLDKEMLQDVIRRNVWSAPSLQGS